MSNPNNLFRTLTRREFLHRSGSAAGGGWLVATWPAVLAAAQVACKRQDEGAAFVILSQAEAATLSAVAEQIIPSNDTPGATDAGVVWFMDAALGGFMADALVRLRDGLVELDQKSEGSFSGLAFEKQTEVLQQVDSTPFFGMVHFMTLAGMFAMPSLGGNTDEAGWKLIGFEDRHVWSPPFGYYDAEEHAAEGGEYGG